MMAALDRLDELEEFMLELQPNDVFRPHSLWRLPLLGTHDYRLPETIDERVGDLVEMARALATAPIELVVCATDVTDDGARTRARARTSSRTPRRTTPPETIAQAVLASAAVSALVLPRPIGEQIATDGAWVRNFPLGYAYDQPGVELIVSFRYLPTYPRFTSDGLTRAAPATRALSEAPAGTRADRRSCARRRSATRAASRRTGAT